MENTIIQTAQVMPVSGAVLLPGTAVRFQQGNADAGSFDDFKADGTLYLALPIKEGAGFENLTEDNFHRNGVTFRVNSVVAHGSGRELMAELIERVSLTELHTAAGIIRADFVSSPDIVDLDEQSQKNMLDYMKKAVREISDNIRGGEQFSKAIEGYHSVNALIMYLSQYMALSDDEKYSLLKTDSLRERSLHFIDFLLRQKEQILLNLQINEKFSEKANRIYREQALREQLRLIQEELHENDGEEGQPDKKDYRARIEEAGMPEEIRKAALEEVEKLEAAGPQGNMEQETSRNYLEFVLALPWKVEPLPPIDLEKAREILDERHYGLKKVKERIIQYLAVMQLRGDRKGSALLLVGPPGTGKTSLGKSIAEALGRKYIRMSLGGIRDESEIRGHRRTYVGAMPGRILQSIKRAGTTNPVIVLDEVDKLLPGGFSGDPSSALLEVLDPEQNNTFTDHYLDLPYDLSDVFFIATANSLETIPAPLLDRMEIIQVNGYTPDEKFHIGREHLIPEVLSDNGIRADQLIISDEVLHAIIDNYTLEAGVRGLKKQLAAVARAAGEQIVTTRSSEPYVVKTGQLDELLGRKVSHHEIAQEDNPPGVVTGLAWTPVGGEILFIETTDMPGSGEVILTGQLGDVMKESARISLSLLKSRLPVNTAGFKDRDLHIHVPSGAVPKDGPSAGIALFTALASLVTGIKVDPRLAMTGEITLRGSVMPIGGLKEKLLGAQRAGIRRVLIPKENVEDLKDVPEEIRSLMTIIPVETVEDVLRETLGITLPRIEHVLLPGGLDDGHKAKTL